MSTTTKIIKRDRGRNGWTVDYKTLDKIQDRTRGGWAVGAEEIEEVILALATEGFVAVEEETDEHDND